MIEPSESTRRISSALTRFGVALDGAPGADPDKLASKKGFGLMLGPFAERVTQELEAAELPDSTKRMLKLRIRQLDEVGTELAALAPSDRFEAPELAILASFLDVTVTMISAALGKEYRSTSP